MPSCSTKPFYPPIDVPAASAQSLLTSPSPVSLSLPAPTPSTSLLRFYSLAMSRLQLLADSLSGCTTTIDHPTMRNLSQQCPWVIFFSFCLFLVFPRCSAFPFADPGAALCRSNILSPLNISWYRERQMAQHYCPTSLCSRAGHRLYISSFFLFSKNTTFPFRQDRWIKLLHAAKVTKHFGIADPPALRRALSTLAPPTAYRPRPQSHFFPVSFSILSFSPT